MPSGKISGFFISANNSYFKLDGAQQSIKLSIDQLILYAKYFPCALSILNFVSSNRIGRLEVSIVFHEDSEISVKSQGVYVSTVILSTVFFVCYHRLFVLRVAALSFFRFLWLLFFCYNSFLIIHLPLQLISNMGIDKTHVLVVTVELTWLLFLNMLSFISTPNKSLRFTGFRKSYVYHPAVVPIKGTLLSCLMCTAQSGNFPFFCSCLFRMIVHLCNLSLQSALVARILLTLRWISRQKDVKQ